MVPPPPFYGLPLLSQNLYLSPSRSKRWLGGELGNRMPIYEISICTVYRTFSRTTKCMWMSLDVRSELILEKDIRRCWGQNIRARSLVFTTLAQHLITRENTKRQKPWTGGRYKPERSCQGQTIRTHSPASTTLVQSLMSMASEQKPRACTSAISILKQAVFLDTLCTIATLTVMFCRYRMTCLYAFAYLGPDCVMQTVQTTLIITINSIYVHLLRLIEALGCVAHPNRYFIISILVPWLIVKPPGISMQLINHELQFLCSLSNQRTSQYPSWQISEYALLPCCQYGNGSVTRFEFPSCIL